MQVTRDEVSGKVIAVMTEEEWTELNAKPEAPSLAKLKRTNDVTAVADGEKVYLILSKDKAMRITTLIAHGHGGLTSEIFYALDDIIPAWKDRYVVAREYDDRSTIGEARYAVIEKNPKT